MGSERAKNMVLKALRIAHGYSITQVSELSGCSKWTVSATENGNRKVSKKILEKITSIYSIDIFQVNQLIKYYDSLDFDEFTKYQFTLLKILNILLKNTGKSL